MASASALEVGPRPAPEAVEVGSRPTSHRLEQAVTGLLVLGPMVLTIWAIARVRTHPPTALDLALAAGMYVVTGFGVTVGYHRLFTHRAFTAVRPLRRALALAGSMAFQGPLVGWVADHRRHHAFTDRDGDPHSPHCRRGRVVAAWRGALHAHTGWLFRHDPTDAERYARDVVGDRDLRRISALFPLLCLASLGLPFAAGWLIGGSLSAAGSALLWAGIVRIAVLHQITWSVNSVCHLVGRRPHPTNDHSTNVRVLAVVSFGESFHNNHHAFPRSARHGLDPGQRDSSAWLIRRFERLGWASELHGRSREVAAMPRRALVGPTTSTSRPQAGRGAVARPDVRPVRPGPAHHPG